MRGLKVQDRKSLLARARYRLRLADESIVSIDAMIRQMEAMSAELQHYVQREEARTRIRDPKHIAYSTVALAARIRADKLEKSRNDLLAKRLRAISEHHLANGALSRLAALQPPSTSVSSAANALPTAQ